MLRYCFSVLFIGSGWAALQYGGLWMAALGAVGLSFVLFHFVVGRKSNVRSLMNNRWYTGYLILISAMLGFATLHDLTKISGSSWSYWIQSVLLLGFSTAAIGITTAHELIHRRSRLLRGIGYFLLMLVNHGPWAHQHLHIHHRWVATPNDPATARYGENLYSFFLRSYGGLVVGSFRKDRPWGRFFWMATLIFSVAIGYFGGLAMMTAWWAQSLLAIFLLETANYIEHYGLARRKKPNGIYEPVGPAHSWDCDFFFSNTILLNLGHHSHHHESPMVHYQDLTQKSGPFRLPYGYLTMFLFAFIPPLWFSVAHPILDKKNSDTITLPLVA